MIFNNVYQKHLGSDITIEQNFLYLSRSAYCYPYLNLTWKVQPGKSYCEYKITGTFSTLSNIAELLRSTSYFYLNISYLYLGEMKVLSKLMNLSSKGNPDKYVTN